MALVPCRECGAEVSAAAPTCPKCGVPAPAGKSAKITVTRPRKFQGAILMLYVDVDDQSASLTNGESITFDLIPGDHVLGVQWGESGGGFEYDFQVGHGESKTATLILKKRPQIS